MIEGQLVTYWPRRLFNSSFKEWSQSDSTVTLLGLTQAPGGNPNPNRMKEEDFLPGFKIFVASSFSHWILLRSTFIYPSLTFYSAFSVFFFWALLLSSTRLVASWLWIWRRTGPAETQFRSRSVTVFWTRFWQDLRFSLQRIGAEINQQEKLVTWFVSWDQTTSGPGPGPGPESSCSNGWWEAAGVSSGWGVGMGDRWLLLHGDGLHASSDQVIFFSRF